MNARAQACKHARMHKRMHTPLMHACMHAHTRTFLCALMDARSMGVTFEQQCPGGKTFPAVAALKNDAVKLLCSNAGGRFVGYGSENVYYIETVDARKGGTSKGYGGNSTTLPPALAQVFSRRLSIHMPTHRSIHMSIRVYAHVFVRHACLCSCM